MYNIEMKEEFCGYKAGYRCCIPFGKRLFAPSVSRHKISISDNDLSIFVIDIKAEKMLKYF